MLIRELIESKNSTAGHEPVGVVDQGKQRREVHHLLQEERQHPQALQLRRTCTVGVVQFFIIFWSGERIGSVVGYDDDDGDGDYDYDDGDDDGDDYDDDDDGGGGAGGGDQEDVGDDQ